MAGDAVVGALRVVLGADTADLDKGLKSSQQKLAVFGDVAKASMAVAAASVVAAAVVIGMSIKSAIDNADKVNKLTQSTGTTVEEFTKLRYAAELADVSQESLSKSLGKLSKAMVSAAGDAAGPAGQAFAALGVSVENADGTLKSSSDTLTEVAGKFEGYRDGAGKTALAIALFGKAGAEMIPLLNLGKQGLADAGDEAERYGLVLDKKTTVAAEAFNDNLKRMDKIKEGLVMTITAKMLPAFEQLSEVMLEARENSTLLTSASDVLTNIFKGIVSAAIQLPVIFQRIGAEFAALVAVFKTDTFSELSTAWTAFQAEGQKTQEVLAGLKITVDNIWKDVPTFDWSSEINGVRAMNKEVQAVAGEWGKVAAPIIASENATKNALATFLASQAKRTAAQNAEAETIGLAAGAMEKLRIVKQADEILDQNKIARTPAVMQSIAAAGDAAAAAALKIQAAQISQQVMSPAAKYAQDLAQLQVVYQSTNMSMETFAARQQQIAEAAGATWGQASASIAGSFATISGAFGKESSAMATAAKVFGVIQGTISMFTGAAKALELPFPANIAAVAAVLAKGASLVASIKSQSVPTGMMTGGSMTVRGGGGPDSVPVNMMLSPGEQVDVWRPDQGGGSDPRGGSTGSKTVNLYMPLVATRDAFFAIIDGLNEAISDGARLKIVPV